MKITLKQTLVAIALAGAFSGAQAASNVTLTSGDLPYDLGTNPTGATLYTVLHDSGSFSDIFTFTLDRPSESGASLAAIEFVQSGVNISTIDNGTLSLYLDNGVKGAGGGDTLISSATFSPNVTLNTTVGNGSYYYAVTGTAEGKFGGKYDIDVNTAPVPEPETYALMLAGLGLIGFIGRRRLNKSSASLNFA